MAALAPLAPTHLLEKSVKFIQIQHQENHKKSACCHFDVILATLNQLNSLCQFHYMDKFCLIQLIQNILRCFRYPILKIQCRKTRFSVVIFSYYVLKSEHADPVKSALAQLQIIIICSKHAKVFHLIIVECFDTKQQYKNFIPLRKSSSTLHKT